MRGNVRVGIVVMLVLASLGVQNGITSQDENHGEDEDTKQLIQEDARQRFMLFSCDFPDEWEGDTEQEHAIIRYNYLRSDKTGNSKSARLPLQKVKEGLWVLDTGYIVEGWTIKAIGIVFRGSDGKATLASFSSSSWTLETPNILTSDKVSRVDYVMDAASSSSEPRNITYHRAWISVNIEDAGLEIDDGDDVMAIVPESVVGSPSWKPLIRISEAEFILPVGYYKAINQSENSLEVKVKVVGKERDVKTVDTVAARLLVSWPEGT